MRKTNCYSYPVKNGVIHGYFNIYQAKSGKIMIQMGDNSISLTKEQVDKLNIAFYELMDFDVDDFTAAYQDREKTQ